MLKIPKIGVKVGVEFCIVCSVTGIHQFVFHTQRVGIRHDILVLHGDRRGIELRKQSAGIDVFSRIAPVVLGSEITLIIFFQCVTEWRRSRGVLALLEVRDSPLKALHGFHHIVRSGKILYLQADGIEIVAEFVLFTVP